MKKRVYLGGTCNGSLWREELIPKLKLDYFNPVVEDWNEEAQANEVYEREHDDFVLYVITPKMQGVYGIAEVVDDSNKKPEKTLLCVLYEYEGETFSIAQRKSLENTVRLIKRNGANTFDSLDSLAEYLNNVE